MHERNLAQELDEILNQNERKSFSVNVSSSYKALGISHDLLSVLPEMLLEDMQALDVNKSKSFTINLCKSDFFEKVILGFHTLSSLPSVVKTLTIEEVLDIRPVNDDFLLYLYFTHIITAFLKVNEKKYKLIETLMSSNNELIQRKTYNAVKMASTQSNDILEYANAIVKNMGTHLNLLELNSVESDKTFSETSYKEIHTNLIVA